MDTLSAGLAGRVIFVWKLVGLLSAGVLPADNIRGKMVGHNINFINFAFY